MQVKKQQLELDMEKCPWTGSKQLDWFQIGNGVAIMVNKRARNAVLGCNLKNGRMISVHFQGKPFNITDHLTCLRNLNAGQESIVRTGHGTTDWF